VLTRVIIKTDGRIGYVDKESPLGELLIRIPRTDGWPFPDYIKLRLSQVTADLSHIPLAPF